MSALFFNSAGKRIFAYSLPPRGTDRREAVVLCYPLGHEYMRTHWAFRQLATRLSRDGYHVFRFDYFGTGDSEGDLQEGSPEIWIRNIQDACDEASRLSGGPVSIVGVRLGALLAELSLANGRSYRKLLLWDPVTDGAAYLEEIRRLTTQRTAEPPLSRHDSGTRMQDPLLGFALTNETERAVAALRLREGGSASSGREIVISSEDYRGRLAEAHLIAESGGWNEPSRVDHALLCNGILNHIVSRMGAPNV
jgi:pimeloyl-ACP methyl ester carboxylesterase